MTRIWLSIAFLFLVVPAAEAQSLFKCVDAKGAESFQSDPCAAGARQVWVRDATPEPPLSSQQQAVQEAKRRRDHADALALSRDAGTDRAALPPRVYSPSASDCAAMRVQEKAYRQTRGLRITHDELRQWGDRVYEACKSTR